MENRQLMIDMIVGAVVLAAGQSKRMGTPKMVLPWGDTTVIGRVVQVLIDSQAAPIVVVTGGAHAQVTTALQGYPVQIIQNTAYAHTEMLQSLQLGLSALPPEVQTSLVVLGDQPQIAPDVVVGVLNRFRQTMHPLIVPSYELRRGHPWLVARKFWDEISQLDEQSSLRNFLSTHAADIDYLVVNTPAILLDLDTPADYQRDKPD